MEHYEIAAYGTARTLAKQLGHGKAAKGQVQEMVKRLLKLPGLPGKGKTRLDGDETAS